MGMSKIETHVYTKSFQILITINPLGVVGVNLIINYQLPFVILTNKTYVVLYVCDQNF